MTSHRSIQVFFVCCVGLLISCDCCAEAASRKLSVSDTVPEFSAMDSQGVEFKYAPTDQTALLVFFFSPEKRQSRKAMADIEGILRSLDKLPRKLSFLAIADDPNSVNTIQVRNTEQLTTHFIKDSDFKLWGKFGVIASPTVFLVGTDGKIEFIKAGYGYDFAPAIESNLKVIMGLISEKDISDVNRVKTVTNDSAGEKANRHLKMAQLLEDRGDYEAAMVQLKTVIQIDSNSIACSLELGRLYCVMSDPNNAIAAVRNIQPSDKGHQALRAFILGKAHGQLKDYPNAEKYLLEAVGLEPKNSHAFYELGRIYQHQNQKDKAIDSYRKSLDLIYSDKK